MLLTHSLVPSPVGVFGEAPAPPLFPSSFAFLLDADSGVTGADLLDDPLPGFSVLAGLGAGDFFACPCGDLEATGVDFGLPFLG